MQPDMNGPALVKVERRSAAADVQAQLQTLIETGRFKQNDRLPSEIELARSFGVSRPVVREALMSLQTLGLTASQSGKGTFVVSDRVRTPLLVGRYSPAHIKEVRRALEIPSAELAAQRRTDKDVGQLAGKLGRPGRDRLVGLFQQLGQQGLAVALLVQDPGDRMRAVRLDDLGDPVADRLLVGNAHGPDFTGARAARGNR